MVESTVALFAAAFGLSLMYNLVPGPVTVEALRRGTRDGVRPVVAVRLGALAGSLAWAVAGLAGAGIALQNPHVHLLLSVTGTALLLLLAGRSLWPARSTRHASAGARTRHGDALAGALITLASPLEAAFWLGVSGLLLDGATAAERGRATVAFLSGFSAADLLFTVAFAAFVGWGRCVAGGRLARVANLLCVASLAWFALSPLLRTLGEIAS